MMDRMHSSLPKFFRQAVCGRRVLVRLKGFKFESHDNSWPKPFGGGEMLTSDFTPEIFSEGVGTTRA